MPKDTVTPPDALAQFRADIQGANFPQLKPEQVLKRAIYSAQGRADDLCEGLKVLEALGGEGDIVTIPRTALEWLAKRLKSDADELVTDMDHAQYALNGNLYHNASERFANTEEA